MTFDVVAEIAERGFAPLEGGDVLVAEYDMTEREASVLDYYARRSWTAFRIETGDCWATLVGWDDGAIRLQAIDRNGVIDTEAEFMLTPTGFAWFVAAIDPAAAA